MIDFDRIKRAIHYINDNYRTQPSLEEVAAAVHLSPFHFQRMFTEWAGISPKKFLQFVSLGHAKQLLMAQESLLTTSLKTGLSGTSRLHDLFMTIDGMTPGEFKKSGDGLQIEYGVYQSIFGEVLVGSTNKGICHLSFLEGEEPVQLLHNQFPKATIVPAENEYHQMALKPLTNNWSSVEQIRLHLKGTPFQLKVWEALLKIPYGKAVTYSEIAQAVKNPKAVRAVGSAIGANPVAYLIPCHRVIQSTGAIGQYHWGKERKCALLGFESLQHESEVVVE